jgi:hypothetical protein
VAKSKAEQLIDQVFVALRDFRGSVDTKTAIGRRETAGHHQPPSVIAVPLGAPVIRQPNRPGDARYTDVGRQLLVREFQIEFWCHGVPDKDGVGLFGEAEQLLEDTIAAVRNVAHHSVEFSDETWVDQQDGGDGFQRSGSTITFLATIQIPLYARRSKTVTPTAESTTFTLNDTEA